MPCESCNVQFSVFRRKRTCAECKRFYCGNCLSTSKRNSQSLLCARCSIFAKRPLLRADLLQLKPKDLIFYLQSKHISTTGCVEKDELIRLVLNHVDENDATSPNQTAGNGTGSNDSFDSLRQTCQNFFFNITENISDTLAAFDGKSSSAKSQQQQQQQQEEQQQQDNNNGNVNGQSPNSSISDQPRVARREIPTYASFLNNTGATSNPNDEVMRDAADGSTPSPSSLASPIISFNSVESQVQAAEQEERTGEAQTSQQSLNVPKLSDCECSDDEIFVSYTARNSLVPQTQPQSQAQANVETPASSSTQNPPSLSTSASTSASASASSSSSSPSSASSQRAAQLNVQEVDDASHSSFEELGALGIGNSVVSEDSGGSNNTEPWQIVEPTTATATAASNSNSNPSVDTQPTVITPTAEAAPPPPRRKLLRRRSDRQRSAASDNDISPTSTTNAQSPQSPANSEQHSGARRRSGTCKRCGKSNLRRYVEKMRSYLESAQMSEEDMKREMHNFLAYLEEQTKSVESTEIERNEAVTSPHAGGSQLVLSPSASIRNDPFFSELYNENDGIHVYGADAASSSNIAEHNARFVNLDDYDDIDDLESLSVKQLKEVLMLHRVDYKGCCEKQELLERVQRLWKNLKSSPAVDKLPTDELCKICMDAPIECVILECGHMATCVTCGKVLSECPICRQYIVRVVRFFRA